MSKQFYKDPKHEYFFIRNNELYEAFKSLRGTRIRHRLSVEGLKDDEKLSDESIKQIEEKFLK